MVVRVRPSVRRAARVVVPILIVVAAWKTWVNVETRRLENTFAPLTAWDMGMPSQAPSGISEDEDRADSYYAAAAVAALGQAAPLRDDLLRRQREALAGGPPLTARETAARDLFLARNSLVTDLVERGSPLRFHMFPDAVTRLRWSGLTGAVRSEALKATHQLASGDISGATLSIVARLRLLRGFDFDLGGAGRKSIEAAEAATDIGFLLSSRRAGESELARLDRALSEVYGDLEVSAVVFRLARSRYDVARPSSLDWPYLMVRPVALHFGVTEQKILSRAMDASRLPWPQRLTAIEGLSDHESWHFNPPARPADLAPLLQRLVPSMATGTAAISAARIAISVERHRQRTSELPKTLGDLGSNQASAMSDPYSGEPLRYKVTATSFAVYSVGSNRRDDGANLARDPSRSPASGVGPTFDVGVEVKR